VCTRRESVYVGRVRGRNEKERRIGRKVGLGDKI